MQLIALFVHETVRTVECKVIGGDVLMTLVLRFRGHFVMII